MKVFRWGLCLVVLLVCAGPLSAFTIWPNDDAYVDPANNAVNYDNLGLKVQNSPELRAYIEFTIPAEVASATSAELVLYQNNPLMGAMRMKISSEVGTINETTLTWLTRPEAAWVPVATFPDKVANDWQPVAGTTGSVTMPKAPTLAWLIAQAGKTVTIRLQAVAPAVTGATFEDREGSLTGIAANGPHIDWVPEPGSWFIMLSAGAYLLIRRR